jgi:hypothetical protein
MPFFYEWPLIILAIITQIMQNPSFIKSLKLQIGEDPDYDKVIARYRSEGLGDATKDMKIVPVIFNKEHKAMLGHCKMLSVTYKRTKNKGYVEYRYYAVPVLPLISINLLSGPKIIVNTLSVLELSVCLKVLKILGHDPIHMPVGSPLI